MGMILCFSLFKKKNIKWQRMLLIGFKTIISSNIWLLVLWLEESKAECLRLLKLKPEECVLFLVTSPNYSMIISNCKLLHLFASIRYWYAHEEIFILFSLFLSLSLSLYFYTSKETANWKYSRVHFSALFYFSNENISQLEKNKFYSFLENSKKYVFSKSLSQILFLFSACSFYLFFQRFLLKM